METLETFWRWAWPPSWSNSPLWIVAGISVICFTGNVVRQAYFPAVATVEKKEPTGKAQGPNMLPVDRPTAGL